MINIMLYVVVLEYVVLGLIFASVMKSYKQPIWLRYTALLFWPLIVLKFAVDGWIDILKRIVNIFRD